MDGGESWQERYSYMDCWSLHFFDLLNGLAGTQQGVYRTADGGLTWEGKNGSHWPAHLFFQLGTSELNPDNYVAGAQDNGSSIYREGTWDLKK